MSGVEEQLEALKNHTLLTKSINRESGGDPEKAKILWTGVRCLLLAATGQVVIKDRSGYRD